MQLSVSPSGDTDRKQKNQGVTINPATILFVLPVIVAQLATTGHATILFVRTYIVATKNDLYFDGQNPLCANVRTKKQWS